eukprot:gene35260-45660_t
MSLSRLINKNEVIDVIDNPFKITVPRNIVIDEITCQKISKLVSDFNNQSIRPTEANGSINKINSIHHLWKQILISLRSPFQGEMPKRIVYEWNLLHPLNDTTLQIIDFTFFPSKLRHLNWQGYSGGLELKNISLKKPSRKAPSESSAASTSSFTRLGALQSMSRAAMSVYARWKESDYSGEHVASCCFADSRSFGVSRVYLGEDKVVKANIFGPIDLPGFNESNDFTALYILKHILTSPNEDLADLMSQPMSMMASKLSGRSFPIYDGGASVELPLGEFLGAGGFALVYATEDKPKFDVIKKAIESSDRIKLHHEMDVSNKLSRLELSHSFPKVLGALATPENMIIALRLTPRGVTVKQYLAAMNVVDSSLIESLVHRMGPTMVRALRVAHTEGISHNDVRDSNILLIPSPAIMEQIVSSGGDISIEPEAIMRIELANCEFVLNDWGESVQIKENLLNPPKTEDLKSLVVLLEGLCSIPGAEDFESGSRKHTNRTNLETSATFSVKTKNKLLKMATALDYEGLIRELEAVHYIVKTQSQQKQRSKP